MKTISECPVCKSKNLKQEFYHKPFDMNTPIGGTHISYPPSLNGTTCGSCGAVNRFNKKGKCPACKGTGSYKTVTSIGGIEQYSTSSECTTCKGTGKI